MAQQAWYQQATQMSQHDGSVRMWRRVFLGLLLMLLGMTAAVLAAGGELDSSFGTNGMVTTDLGGYEEARAMVALPDGSLVVAGYNRIARYTANGALDGTFGTTGVISAPFVVRALGTQSTGKVIAAGIATTPTGGKDFGVARFNHDGSLDTTFGISGTISTDFNRRDDWGLALAIEGDDKIVVGGMASYVLATGDADFALARYTADGQLDPEFRGGGKQQYFFEDTGYGPVEAVAVQRDGKIVVAFLVDSDPNPYYNYDFDFGVARYHPNGFLDTTFGFGGIMVNGFVRDSNDHPYALGIAIDGKIVVAGRTGRDINNGDFGVMRYHPNGTLDNSFGTAGKVTSDFLHEAASQNDEARALVIQSDGKILVGGYSYWFRVNCCNGEHVALARYTLQGTLDATFGGGGKVLAALGSSRDRVYGLALPGYDKVVVAGNSQENILLARYLTGALPPCGVPGDVDNNRVVEVRDFQILASGYRLADPRLDLNADGLTTMMDVMQAVANFGLRCE